MNIFVQSFDYNPINHHFMVNSLQIDSVPLQKMYYTAHFAFMHSVIELFDTEKLASHGFDGLINDLKVALSAQSKAANVNRKSFFTVELVKINQEREDLYAGFYFYHQSCMRHYDKAVRKAAEETNHLIKNIATIHNCSNKNRTHRISFIVEVLRKSYADVVEQLKMGEWLHQLEMLNMAYERKEQQRFEKRIEDGSGNAGKKRVATDRAYRALIKRLNALIELEGMDDYRKTVELLNVEIKSKKKSIAIREGMRRGKKARLAAAANTAAN